MPTQDKVKINVAPDRMEAHYSDFAIVAKNAIGFNLDFGQRVPGAKQVNILSRIAMSPQHAKLFSDLLSQNVSDYEKQFGEISVPKRPVPEEEEGLTIHFSKD